VPKVEIVAVGSEMLTPERMDTNSLWLTAQLNDLGYEVTAKAVIGDDLGRLVAALLSALQHADVVIAMGGLGPTEDDLTREAAAQALGLGLEHQEFIWQDLLAKFQRMGRPIPVNNRRQAQLLSGAQSLPNPLGTAPGQFWSEQDKILILLPGPPRELKPMFTQWVAPRLREQAGELVLQRRLFKVIGMGESALDEMLQPLYAMHPQIQVTTLFTPLDLEVHLTCTGSDDQSCRAMLLPLEQAIEERLGQYAYSRSQQTLAQVVVHLLKSQQKTLVTAESLTGGMVAERVTAVPGASEVFWGGWVTYTDTMKHQLLGVDPQVLRQQGAVSAAVVEAMAQGARNLAGSDYALSLSGVAGPDGGSDEHPVGCVYLGYSGPDGVKSRRCQFPGDREGVRSRAAQTALDWLRRALL